MDLIGFADDVIEFSARVELSIIIDITSTTFLLLLPHLPEREPRT